MKVKVTSYRMRASSMKPCMNFTSQSDIMPPGTIKIECSTCSKLFAPSYLYTHWQRNHKEVPKYHTCPKCGKNFHEKHRLRNHEETKHPEYNILLEGEAQQLPIRSHMCDVCESSFFTADALKDHIKRQHEEDPVRYYCLKCGKGYKNNRIFSQHLSKNHKGIACVHCPPDTKKFGSKGALKKHTQDKHGETRTE